MTWRRSRRWRPQPRHRPPSRNPPPRGARPTAPSDAGVPSGIPDPSGDRTRLAHHLADFRDERLLGRDLRARILLEHDAASADLGEELAVLRKALLLVYQRLAQDLVDVVLMGLEQCPNAQRGVAAEIG